MITTIRLTRSMHRRIQDNLGYEMQFIHTYSCSGSVKKLKSGKWSLGCANYKGAGRGYVFNTFDEMYYAVEYSMEGADLDFQNYNFCQLWKEREIVRRKTLREQS